MYSLLELSPRLGMKVLRQWSDCHQLPMFENRCLFGIAHCGLSRRSDSVAVEYCLDRFRQPGHQVPRRILHQYLNRLFVPGLSLTPFLVSSSDEDTHNLSQFLSKSAMYTGLRVLVLTSTVTTWLLSVTFSTELVTLITRSTNSPPDRAGCPRCPGPMNLMPRFRLADRSLRSMMCVAGMVLQWL